MLPLTRTPEYIAARKGLSRNARVVLSIVEEGIQADPHHLVRRHLRPSGGVVDYSAEGLLVAYRIRDPDIELLDVIDLREAPWYP